MFVFILCGGYASRENASGGGQLMYAPSRFAADGSDERSCDAVEGFEDVVVRSGWTRVRLVCGYGKANAVLICEVCEGECTPLVTQRRGCEMIRGVLKVGQGGLYAGPNRCDVPDQWSRISASEESPRAKRRNVEVRFKPLAERRSRRQQAQVVTKSGIEGGESFSRDKRGRRGRKKGRRENAE